MTEVSDARDLLLHVELEGIEFYELRGKVLARDDEAFEESYNIQAALKGEPGFLRTRFSLTFEAAQAQYFVDLAVRYSVDEGIDVPESVALEFVEKVGVMAAFPYLRENVHGIASRMSHPIPVLGIIKQGDFRITPDEAAPGPSGDAPA